MEFVAGTRGACGQFEIARSNVGVARPTADNRDSAGILSDRLAQPSAIISAAALSVSDLPRACITF
jgi:hypothetical protein